MREATLKKIIDYPCISIETDFLKGVMSLACLKIVLKISTPLAQIFADNVAHKEVGGVDGRKQNCSGKE